MTQAAQENLTIPALFAATVTAHGDEEALGVIENGSLHWQTWRQLAEKVAAWTAELAAQGVRPGDRVAQLGPNSEGWIVADLAIQSLGAVHVPMHVSLAAPQIAEQVAHAGARLLLVRSNDLADHARPALDKTVRVVLHGELSAAGAAAPLTVTGPSPDDLATVLYTSGTTGAPRGVMLTQRNVVINTVTTADAVDTGELETRLLILPLSHIYARTCDLYCWIYRGSRMAIAESRETALRDCRIVQPTVINAVPYFYQKVADGLRRANADVDERAVREALGGKIKMLYCGGAALALEVEEFFSSRGMSILCGYGLTEASPVITASTPDTYSQGSSGRPLANVEVRIADDGEVLARGPSIMQGYWHNAEDTAQVLHEGWLHTGDLGEWDANGNLRIVGRKKEMLVLATGKKVAPTRIEQLLVGSKWIEQCCVLGDGRKCLAALIVPHADALREEIRRQRLVVWSRHRALTHPRVRALYRQEIDRCLLGAADFEQVGCFTLVGRGFSAELGEMTPKLSLRRNVIEQSFAREIEAMYATLQCPATLASRST